MKTQKGIDATANSDGGVLLRAFTTLRNHLLHSAATIVGRDEAEDVLHDAFQRLWCRRDKIGTETEARKQLHTSVRNASISLWRHQRVTGKSIAIDSATEVATTEKDTTALLYDEVEEVIEQSLPDKAREILMLRDADGLSYNEISKQMGMNEAAVRQSLSRARKAVRQQWAARQKQENETT